jgi:uncharacterized membrane protein
MVWTLARLINLILAGMLTGHEFAGLLAVYPALGKLPPLERLRAEQEIYRRYGKVMPIYMSSTIASFIPVLALARDRRSPAYRFSLAGAGCFVAMLAVTLTRNVPINNRIVEAPVEEASVEEFRELRERWDRLHAVRNLLNLSGLVFTCLGVLSRAESGERL